MLSSRARYALRALLDLAENDTGQPVLVQDIADRQTIPLKFLQQIMLDLKQGGLVASRKGPGGGYMLSKPPEQITLADILGAVESDTLQFSCSNQLLACECPHPNACAIREALDKAAETINKALSQNTLSDLKRRQGELDLQGRDLLDYTI